MGKPSRFAPEVRERAMRLVAESEDNHSSHWAAVVSVAEKIGCSAETLRSWERAAERNAGKRAGLKTSDQERINELERENRELRRANEILHKASAFFAQVTLSRAGGRFRYAA